jgi:hypothetical protein
MKVKIIKATNASVIQMTTKLTEDMLKRVPNEAKVLKDEDGKVVFKVNFASEPSIKPYGVSVSGQSFIVPIEGSIEDATYLLADVQQKFKVVEENVVSYYNMLVKQAKSVAVEELKEE